MGTNLRKEPKPKPTKPTLPPSSFKILPIGDYNTGKTSLALSYLDCADQMPVRFPMEKQVKINRKQQICVKVYDTFGQEDFKMLPGLMFYNIDGFMLVYDVTSRESFLHVLRWYHVVCGYQKKMVLVGNKRDVKQERAVTFDEGKELADKIGVSFFETSVNMGINVHEAFEYLLR